MTEQEALKRMIAPGTRRPGKYRDGVIQIHVTRACNLSCFNCTQGSQLAGKAGFITPSQFETAVRSLSGYWGVVGVFGGNPAIHPQFVDLCAILRKHVPFEQRGLWCNHPISADKARAMRETFDPAVSNLNVHLDVDAYAMFKEYWPESRPFGLTQDSRHSPPYVAMRDVLKKDCPGCDGEGSRMFQLAKEESTRSGGQRVFFTGERAWEGWYYVNGSGQEIGFKTLGGYCYICRGTKVVYDEEKAWELISGCDINRHWSAMIGVFRGELRAWFCEIAGAQAMLHQHEEGYPDTGLKLTQWGNQVGRFMWESGNQTKAWWELPMEWFAAQVRKHCHDCGVPLRGYGELAQSASPESREQVSATHQAIYRPKRSSRAVELVTTQEQLGRQLERMTDYLGNSKR